MKYAILIDGGFIRRKLGSRARPAGIGEIAAFLETLSSHQKLRGMRLYRVYWYDAPPLMNRVHKPLRGGQVDFSRTLLARASAKLLNDLRGMPFVSIRRGDLVFRGWRLRGEKLPNEVDHVTVTAGEIVPIVQQKGVDMRLGLDIAALTLKAHVGAIVLVAGDSDFVPAMKFARREGVQIFLVTLGHAVREGMVEHSDVQLFVACKRRESGRDGVAAQHRA